MLEILLFGRDAKGVQHEPDVVSEAIQIWLHSPYSHSAIRANGVIYEANWPVVRKLAGQDAVAYGNAAVAHCVIPATDEQIAKGIAWAETTLGDHYSLAGLFGFIADLHLEMPHEYICSSYCASFLGHSGVRIYDDPMLETPKSLAEEWGVVELAGVA